MVISDDAPSSPNAGDLWWESDTGRLKVYYNDGDSQWVDTASGITDQITATGGKFVSDSIGINTVSSVGLGTTAKSGYQLYVEGNARVTGVLTVGQASLTLDGDNNIVNVGTGFLTLGHTQGVQFHTQNLHASGFEINNINATGIVTATKIDAPIEGALNTTGVVTATGGIQGIGIFSGGTSITAGVVTSLNFTGDGTTVTNTSGKIDITVPNAVAISTEAPSAPAEGDLWWNNDTGNMAVYYEDVDTNQWVSGGVGPQGPRCYWCC